MFEFQNLEVYKKAKKFNAEVNDLLKEINTNKIIADQFSMAAFSIVLNIAEGSGRFSKSDRKNSFIISRGSVFECVAILDVLKDKKLIDDSRFYTCLARADELSRILFSMIKNLEVQKAA